MADDPAQLYAGFGPLGEAPAPLVLVPDVGGEGAGDDPVLLDAPSGLASLLRHLGGTKEFERSNSLTSDSTDLSDQWSPSSQPPEAPGPGGHCLSCHTALSGKKTTRVKSNGTRYVAGHVCHSCNTSANAALRRVLQAKADKNLLHKAIWRCALAQATTDKQRAACRTFLYYTPSEPVMAFRPMLLPHIDLANWADALPLELEPPPLPPPAHAQSPRHSGSAAMVDSPTLSQASATSMFERMMSDNPLVPSSPVPPYITRSPARRRLPRCFSAREHHMETAAGSPERPRRVTIPSFVPGETADAVLAHLMQDLPVFQEYHNVPFAPGAVFNTPSGFVFDPSPVAGFNPPPGDLNPPGYMPAFQPWGPAALAPVPSVQPHWVAPQPQHQQPDSISLASDDGLCEAAAELSSLLDMLPDQFAGQQF